MLVSPKTMYEWIQRRDIMSSLLDRISNNANILPPKLVVLAQYIEKNYMDLAYTSMTRLAELASVSPTSVLRLVSILGYSGFPEFRDSLRAEINANQSQFLRQINIDNKTYTPDKIFEAVFAMEIRMMEETLTKIDPKVFQETVDLLYNAPQIIITAAGNQQALAQTLLFGLQVLRDNIINIDNLGLSDLAYLHSAPKGTVLVCFSIPRYPIVTQETLKIAKNHNMKIIGFSDSTLSPIFSYCDYFFQAAERFITFFDSHSIYCALIHSIVIGLYLKDINNAEKRIKNYYEYTQNHYIRPNLKLVDVTKQLIDK